MNIREVDLRINRNNFPSGEPDAHKDLKRRIYRAWKTYTESVEEGVTNAAYSEWGRLVNELRDIEPLK